MKKIFTVILVIASLLAIWVFRIPVADLLNWFGNREAVVYSIQELGAWGPFVLIVLLILQVFLAFIPGQALMVACGYVYGFGPGFLISWFGLFAGGQAAFALARRYGRPFAERWIAPQVLSKWKWDKAANGQGVGFYALSLVLPIFPNDAMCYVAGLGKITSRRFALANSLGRALACLFTSAAGAFGAHLSLHVWGIIGLVILLVCLGWVVVRHVRPNFQIE
ncbi:MAG: TVP38/TMEM64 family protein [Anaerolineales bacterium]|nr:TVP38/TMEM64 family protein [Anaerolineales bacterium]